MTSGYKVYRSKRSSANLWPQKGEYFNTSLEGAALKALEDDPIKEGATEIIAVLNLGREGGLGIFEVSVPLPEPKLTRLA